ncbi:hypothetical protein H4F05_13740 [Vibrio cholerae]
MGFTRTHYFAVLLSVLLTACGSGSDSSSSTGGNAGANTLNVSGSATAPGGSVAMLEHRSIIERVFDEVFPPLYAGITGLQPVTGALVELIRIDDNGNQVGDVLATTYTSITGDYTLTVPEGVSLAGNLVVKISGNSGIDMRAQVVQESVDISPATEFVLRKFIQSGTDLDTLTTASVIKLKGQVEEFDLTSSSDMSTMLAALDNEVGEFVDQQIASINTTTSSAVDISGNYRLSEMVTGLHDGDWGTYALDLYYSSVTLTGDSNGNVEFVLTDNEGAWGNMSGNDDSENYSAVYYTEMEDDEAISATYDSAGVLTIDSEFEEEIDGDWGWRSPPHSTKFQKVSDMDVAFSLSAYNAARYATIDTNEDGTKDALDPDGYSGAEVGRGLILLAKQPSNMSASDLTGEFGRVYLGSRFTNQGEVEIEAESNVLTFSGSGTLDISQATQQHLSRSSGYSTETINGETGIAIVTDASGDVSSVGGENADGFVNAGYNFLVFYNASGTDGTDMEVDTTLAVKLPSSAPVLTNRTYKLILSNAAMLGQKFELLHSGFSTTLTFSSETAAELTGPITSIDLPSLGASLETSKETVTLNATSSVAANGAVTLTVSDDEGSLTMTGYFNESASLGVLTTATADTNSDPDGLGLAILVEIE